ncbi:transporter substrate-binding domain-containing protein [Pseudomonas benzenivorans]|uniref:Transporter substrate-binding domain-containing protein n=1 Tax=Pseudomonas benzenivorans TaxID=556533 RepID=A0ABZ0PZ17_9PSED|nr:transporter substrate-binding domain-containing protein [Pseudomonas benzenivorans]WPC05694.1 transporter substrate-binding domain-containing protein [Pseudomonas benzenivorans]
MGTRLVVALLCWLAAGQALAAEPIRVAWRDKAPYHYWENGRAQGFLLQRARRLFAAAEVPAVFVERPSKRIWRDFQRGKQGFCSIGWYRLPERERLAQFSLPFHVDPPHTLLARAETLPAIRAHASFASLLGDPDISLGVVDGVSYGPELDALIAGSANRVVRVTLPPAGLMQMVAAGRVDYMLADQADWQYLRRRDDGLSGLAEYHFHDMPPGLERYILCSKDVSTQVMGRLNRAIAALSAQGGGQ